MPTIYDWKGNRHDLTTGAFDSSSLQNPHMADIKLFGGLGSIENGDERALFNQLSQSYLRSKVDPGVWERFKKQVPNLATIGGTLGTKLLMTKIKVLAGPNPILQSAITAGEIVLGAIFAGGTKQKKSFREPRTGQWVFVESDNSYRRRLQKQTILNDNPLTKPSPGPAPETIKEAAGKWGIAFYLRNSPEWGHGVVYDCEANKEREVRFAQLVNVPSELGEKLDKDENLSVLRELYILANSPDRKLIPDNNLSMGKRITRTSDNWEMRIISSSDTGLMAVDKDGRVRHLNKADVKPLGEAVTTPGVFDDYFLKDGRSRLYAGIWCWSPARPWVKENFPCDYELTCFAIINQDVAGVYYVLDGDRAEVAKSELLPCNNDDQEMFNSDKALKKFRIAASRDLDDLARVSKPIKALHKYVTAGKAGKRSKQSKVLQAEEPDDFPLPTKEVETVLSEKGPERGTTKERLDRMEEAFQLHHEDVETHGREIEIIEEQIQRTHPEFSPRPRGTGGDDDDGMGIGVIVAIAGAALLLSTNMVA